MTATNGRAPLEVSVLASSDFVHAEICDRRLETVNLFGGLSESQRQQLVHDSWSIGLRALANAHAQAQESKLQDIGAALSDDIDKQLRAHVESQQKTIETVLQRFFDPKDGQVSQRLAAFVDDKGVLARFLDRYIGPENSVLAASLARQVGTTSPLFKALSPTESEGLIKILEGKLRKVMEEGRAEFSKALDPLAEDGAVARFIRSLREELKRAEENRAKQLSTALAALDANDRNSLISRLVRETEQARQDVLSAVNPDAPQSPLGILKASLTKLLKEQANSQTELARQQFARQESLEKEVREALVRIDERRSQDQKSTRGGLDFEDAVIAFVAKATRGTPCLFDATGHATGAVERSKKGDAVLRFTAESAFEGAGVVFEAKRDASFTPQRALDELDAARKNRNAVAGVFVMARSHATESFPRFARYGANVLVTWDHEDPGTDVYLHAALLLGMALVTRSRPAGDTGDINALTDVGNRIEKELDRLGRMEKHNDAVRRNSDGLSREIGKAQKALRVLCRKAQSTLKALNVELQEEDVERESPITLPNGSLDEAIRSLPLSAGSVKRS